MGPSLIIGIVKESTNNIRRDHSSPSPLQHLSFIVQCHLFHLHSFLIACSTVGRRLALSNSRWHSMTCKRLSCHNNSLITSLELSGLLVDEWNKLYVAGFDLRIIKFPFLSRPSAGKEDILVNCCCPGWVKTDMAGNKALLTPDQGAETPVFLAFLPPGSPSGELWRDKKIEDWLTTTWPYSRWAMNFKYVGKAKIIIVEVC